MSDGTTAIHVSPVPTEEDMTRFRQMIDNALNSILAASELSKQLLSLQGQFAELKQDMEYVRARNRELDQSLADVRGQRDQAMRERDAERSQNVEISSQLSHAHDESARALAEIADLKAHLETARKDRDHAYAEWDKADRAKTEAEDKLSSIEEMARGMFGLAKPKPEPVNPTQAYPDPIPALVTDNPPSVQHIPITDGNTPAERVYEGDPGFAWDRPSSWDEQRKQYYINR